MFFKAKNRRFAYLIHRIKPVFCLENIAIEDNVVYCKTCNRPIAAIAPDKIYILRPFKRFRPQLEEMTDGYREKRKNLDDIQREWDAFISDLKQTRQNALLPVQDDEWAMGEDSEG